MTGKDGDDAFNRLQRYIEKEPDVMFILRGLATKTDGVPVGPFFKEAVAIIEYIDGEKLDYGELGE
jgi:hypothetical protein